MRVDPAGVDGLHPLLRERGGRFAPLGEALAPGDTAEDAARRLDVVLTDEATEVSVRGQTAYLLEGQRIVWLVDGDPDTYLDIDGPADVGTDELLTIANGLELAE